MLELGFNTGEAFEKEYQANDTTKYIFETISSGFDVSIPKGVGRSQEALDQLKDKLMNAESGMFAIFEKQLRDRYDVDLKFIKIHDIQLRKGKWVYFYTFRNIKPMTVKEFIDYFEPDGLCYVYYPCTVVKIEEDR